MNNRILILVLTLSLSILGVSNVFANDVLSTTSTSPTTEAPQTSTSVEPLSVGQTSNAPASYARSSRLGVGANSVSGIADASQGLGRTGSIHDSWGSIDLPGEGGWETGGSGNVGYPIGDASIPMLLMMVVIYFVYRGVSSSKRRNRI